MWLTDDEVRRVRQLLRQLKDADKGKDRYRRNRVTNLAAKVSVILSKAERREKNTLFKR